jgi:hypothetical protein
MKTLIALEKLIKTLEVSISVAKAKMLNHESGEEKLTLMVQASIENSLEVNEPLLRKYQILHKELEKYDDLEPIEKDRVVTSIERKKYYINSKPEYSKDQIKRNDKKLEVLMIMDELPDETVLETKELFQMALKSIEHYLYFDIQEEALGAIKKEFDLLIKDLTDENIKDLGMFHYMIPIIVLHFNLLGANIAYNQSKDIEDKKEEVSKEEIEDTKKEEASNEEIKDTEKEEASNEELEKNSDNEIAEKTEEKIEEKPKEEAKPFGGFPKFQDWWIGEMWTNHHAYFSLFRWKKEILKMCDSDEQKEGWNLIFHNWILMKVLLFEKGEMAFEYNYAFDTLMAKFANLQEEIDPNKLGISEEEIDQFLKSEDLLSLTDEHSVLTPYLKFKMDNVEEENIEQ